MSTKARVCRLERRRPRREAERYPMAIVLDTGERFVLIDGTWQPWPNDQPLPPVYKVYGFDVRGI